MIEREIRFKIDDEIKSNIINTSELLEESTTRLSFLEPCIFTKQNAHVAKPLLL